ncbi:MAG: FCD domain-containing protein [Pseudomonadota bacterium]
MSGKVARRSSADVATEMRRAIGDGLYRRFERLPASRQMAEDYGVARNTLRDAIYQLEKEGLLETRPGSGTYVTAVNRNALPPAVEEASPLELIDARFALEPHICRLAVLHGRREDFEIMERLCGRMEAGYADPVGFAEADTAFHRALAEATRNNLLIWLIGQINAVRSLDEWTRMRHLTLDRMIIRAYNRQHREVLNAVRAREPERAASKMKEHLEHARLSLTRAAET